MSKSIAIFGAGPGLGHAVALRYARDGYTTVLVARRREPLVQMVDELTRAGGQAHAVTADLADTASAGAVAAEIRARVGTLDTLYYGPTPGGEVRPTPGPPVRSTELTPQHVQAYMPTSVHTLIALVREFLPHMLEQRHGAVLAAGGASAVRGVPYFSGPGPALAAQRNYLQSLETELVGTGVFVGRLYIGATIQGSAWHRQLQEQQAAGRPARTADPLVDPDALADRLWTMQHVSKQPESIYRETMG